MPYPVQQFLDQNRALMDLAEEGYEPRRRFGFMPPWLRRDWRDMFDEDQLSAAPPTEPGMDPRWSEHRREIERKRIARKEGKEEPDVEQEGEEITGDEVVGQRVGDEVDDLPGLDMDALSRRPSRSSGSPATPARAGQGRTNTRPGSPGITAMRQRIDAKRIALGKAPKYPGGVPGADAIQRFVMGGRHRRGGASGGVPVSVPTSAKADPLRGVPLATDPDEIERVKIGLGLGGLKGGKAPAGTPEATPAPTAAPPPDFDPKYQYQYSWIENAVKAGTLSPEQAKTMTGQPWLVDTWVKGDPPNPDDYETYEDYEKAANKWRGR